ncbi:M48 family metallopeptidase [Streptomyces sp. NBC_01257]|uniref:M48 family metallopeptidase n=1 Tax=Streptomyces sp. NBC_01257 TaxID=2903799 RepID=UPI002DD808B7|nr:SprT family zinc-dependent metalloprotease [Streptomyces sp. NBC_01257]WRZ67359.1 M48 family metallopeptidase [Streptomyces sp. NBC_01257]
MHEARAEPLLLGGLAIDVVAVPGRKSVRVTVERDATITAAVPPGTDHKALETLLRSRLTWLYAKVGDRRADAAERPTRRFIDGEGFYYLGRSYRLKTVREAPRPFALVEGRMRLRQDRRPTAAEDLIAWYAERGRQWLPARVAPWAERMKAPMTELTVRTLGYRWGSCSHAGAINVHWAAMQLPSSLIDYVLVHELAHLHQANHSPEFWQVVSRVLPNFESRRQKLDEWGAGIWLPDSP